MRLSVYLIRETVTEFNEVLQSKHLEGRDAFIELSPTEGLPYECKAFVQKNKAKPPRWLPFLSTHFETASLELNNQSNSFVLLVKASHRLFAVTFGHGFQAIDRSKIEPRFGLMVAANTLNPEHIRTLETNLVDTVTRNKRTHVSMGSPVTDFELNPHVDWIRKLSGTPAFESLAKFVSGSDSVCIGVNCELSAVGAKCSELLVAYESEAYKDRFGFLDHLRPLGRDEPEIQGLETQLSERFGARSHDRISIAFPDVPDEELLHHYNISGDRRSEALDELTLEGIYQFIADTEISPEPENIHIVGVGDNSEPVTKRRCLREYLVCEIDQDDETYIFCLGHWFRAEQDYVQRIRNEVSAIVDLSTQLDLPPIRNLESEGDYNSRLADNKEWLLMDKNNFQIANTYDRVEVADLFTGQTQLICAKKMEKSSTLSHLFAQGSVSARLLRESQEYRDKLNEAAATQWPEQTPLTSENLRVVTIVYAIATRKEGSLANCMFFFSLVNLLNHARAVRLVGCEVALCKIEYEESAPRPRRIPRQRRRQPHTGNGPTTGV